jgi:radical SAM superfamily enzyme YgiQ (UPF0313 family)
MKYEVIILTHLSVAPMTKTMGPYRIADSLRRNNFSVQVIGMVDTFSNDELLETILSFTDHNTKIIGVSTTFFQEVDVKQMHKNLRAGISNSLKDVLIKVKDTYPKIKIISGGSHSHQQIGDELFDAVFHGYADNSVVEYAQSIAGEKKPIWKKIKDTKIIEGESYPVDIEHLRHQWEDNDIILPGETLPIEISRGCIFKCKFCNFQLTGKKKLDYIRNYEFLKEEFIRNYERFGVTNYTFCDDTFNDSTEKLERIHKVITDLPFKINFTTYLRLDLLYAYKEQIPLLKEMGLRSGFFGIESLNLESAKAVGKGFNSEKIKDFLLDLKENHLNTDSNFVCSFIIGLPYETIDSCERTFRWCQDYDINTIWSPLFIRTTARYQSEIDKNYEKYGYRLDRGNDYSWTNDWLNYDDAYKVAVDFNTERNNTVHTWPLLDCASLNLGTWEELVNTRLNDLIVNPLVHSKMQEKIAEYKKMLMLKPGGGIAT